ncbi:flavin monoamine oxidase family protein [Thalassotalea crassostreae]|uniref:flavin monoamine oxidase family protein n=1 Tax=Thalassotalea crassostreae TaxID=1763536 RepID=UPI000837FD54|nr:FAD-dependent oxidoreductase [Thalassotalea crassostreae]
MYVENLIIGGGISGLLCASQLEQIGLPYSLLEAKAELGGRIFGIEDKETSQNQCQSQKKNHYHDLGPTWIFPHQRHIQQLLKQMNIPYFNQYTQGPALFEKQGEQGIFKTEGAGAMESYRVQGGMTQIIENLIQCLDAGKIKNQSVVTNATRRDGKWHITFMHHNKELNIETKNLILALPPRMITKHLNAQEWASKELFSALEQVPTWMAAQAKFIATYKHPFWREQGLSGQLFSQQGPMQEMHDASADDVPPYALFGFIGLPANYRAQFSDEQIEQACLAQLHKIYGEQATRTESTFLKDWATDGYSTSELDIKEPAQHPNFAIENHEKELRSKNLYLAGSEFSDIDAGYLEGAVCAVSKVIEQIKLN